MIDKINILVGTPAYNNQLHIDFVNSILDFHKNKLPFTLMMVGNESLITRGRNTIISYFYAHQEFSHLLFLDADIGIQAIDVVKLLQHDKDVIGAAVPLKGFDAEGKKVYNVNKPVKVGSLFEVEKVGTAVFMLSRKAVDALIVESVPYEGNPLTRGENNKNIMYDVFKTGIEDSKYLSEDFYVCKKLRELGFKVFVDDTIIVIHNGMFRF
jgi:hypothetical protein